MGTERIQKILARGGLASRRAAEAIITGGRVRINGRVVTELGAKADPRRDRIEVDGKRVVAEPPVYYALNKPRGYVTTLHDPEGRPTIASLARGHAIGGRVFPIGRLDFHTSGILLLTNDGELSEGLLHPRQAVPKTYVVKVQGVMEPKDIDKWRNGVELEDGRTLPADAAFLRFEGDKTWLEITIREGRNQQIRRMGDATGFRVMRLARTAFAGITSDDLPPGHVRPLTYEELVEMKKKYGVPRSPAAAKDVEAAAPVGRGGATRMKRTRTGVLLSREGAGEGAREPERARAREGGRERGRSGAPSRGRAERAGASRGPGAGRQPPREARGGERRDPPSGPGPAHRERGVAARGPSRPDSAGRGRKGPQRPAAPNQVRDFRGGKPRVHEGSSKKGPRGPAAPSSTGDFQDSRGGKSPATDGAWGRDAAGRDRPQSARGRHRYADGRPGGATSSPPHRQGGWRGHGPDDAAPREVPRLVQGARTAIGRFGSKVASSPPAGSSGERAAAAKSGKAPPGKGHRRGSSRR